MRPAIARSRSAALLVVVVVAAAGCSASESATSSTITPVEDDAVTAVVYRSATCGCCKSYEDYLRRHGFGVTSEVTEEMDSVKSLRGIPADAESCHTAVIGDYVVEGHVPVEAIEKLLDERPDVDGIAVAGMPLNSPGMGEPDGQPIEVLSINDGRTAPFARI